jgi:hypothetical protein
MIDMVLKYLVAILLAATLACGGLAYHQSGQIVKLTQDVNTYKDAAATNLKGKEDADKACLITVDSLNSYYQEQSSIQTSQKATGDAILALPTLTIKEKANAAPTASQEVSPKVQPFADDDRLSPDLMRLLDTAYCHGDKDGCATTTK